MVLIFSLCCKKCSLNLPIFSVSWWFLSIEGWYLLPCAPHALIHSFIQSFIHSSAIIYPHSPICIYLFFLVLHMHSVIHSFIHSFIHSSVIIYPHSYISAFMHSFIRNYLSIFIHQYSFIYTSAIIYPHSSIHINSFIQLSAIIHNLQILIHSSNPSSSTFTIDSFRNMGYVWD